MNGANVDFNVRSTDRKNILGGAPQTVTQSCPSRQGNSALAETGGSATQ